MSAREDLQKSLQEELVDRSQEEKLQNYPRMKEMTRYFLHRAQHDFKFIHHCVKLLLEAYIHTQGEEDCKSGSHAFFAFHVFFLNLYDFPYKKEHKTIKRYNGFFQAKIMNELKEAERLLELLGYKSTNTYCWVLQGKLNRKILAELACDCYIAHVECLIIQNIYENVRGMNYSVIHVWQCRTEFEGSEEECIEWIRLNVNRPKNKTIAHVASGHSKPAVATESVGDNLMNTRFVVGLTQSQSQKKHMVDSAYMSKSHRSFPGGISTVPLDTEIPDDAIYATDGGRHDSGNESEHDMYSEATQDEFIQQSLQLLKEDRPSSTGALAEFSSPAEGGEWDFVYNKLRDTEGDQYFEGERGDILKKINVGVQQQQKSTRPELNDKDRLHLGATRYSEAARRPTALPRSRALVTCGEQAHRSFANTFSKPPNTVSVDGPASPTSPSGVKHLPGTAEVAYPPSYYKEPACRDGHLDAREKPDGISVQNLHQDDIGGKFGFSGSSQPQYFKQADTISATDRVAPLRVSLPYQVGPSNQVSPSRVQVVKPLAPREPKSLNSPLVNKGNVDVQMWKCEACTYVNLSDSPICEMCDRSRTPKVKTMTIGGPDCPQCTLVNEPGSLSCAACGYGLAGAPTYI
ncbi:uncharacterized protein LOC106160366 [Lingula anatina]|uniref:Uncharacterized protein LOC106160366 n=1 Tax=Lingula anatina TaxID=7574 RepID=A0A1S3I2A6_LINAN|nr:uncharacterized protein LOC106160366 [Lingula anatina]|eukprot:XP_013392402.1 uncharacterized protein LOC106160366 [Lingula anatina]